MMPASAPTRAAWHGVLTIPVFFGTVISLERAVAMQRVAPYLASTGTVVASFALLVGAPVPLVQALLVIAAGILVTASIKLAWRQTMLFLVVLTGAAVCWAVGNGVWLIVGDVSAAVPWWLSFLILTIAGERLELPGARATMCTRQFGIIVVVILASAACAPWRPEGPLCVFAGGLLALAAWLARHDVGRHTVRQTGLVRFIAVCLLSGYGWPSARCWVSAAPWRPGMHGGTLRCTRSHWASCSRCSSATRLSSCRPSCGCAWRTTKLLCAPRSAACRTSGASGRWLERSVRVAPGGRTRERGGACALRVHVPDRCVPYLATKCFQRHIEPVA